MSAETIISYASLANGAQWRADTALSQRQLPSSLAPTMVDRGSLTAALRNISDGTFQVHVLSQVNGVPLWHEQRKLRCLPHSAALIRQVTLNIHGEAVVYARSIIPLPLANKGAQGLATLGDTPLGHLLFKDGRMRASRRDFSEASLANQRIHARRTPYEYLGHTILVSEFFLPALNQYLQYD